MKTIIISVVFSIFSVYTYGQKVELNVNALTNVFGFRGSGTTKKSYVNGYHLKSEATTNNVYGQTGDFSYSVEIQTQRITKNNTVYGLGLGYEMNASKVKTDSLIINDVNQPRYAASGKTVLRSSFITFNPFVGQRLVTNKITFDLLVGLDLAVCTESKEQGALTLNGENLTFENTKNKPTVDYRPRVQVKAQFQKFGAIVGYSLGLTNYTPEQNTNAYSKLLRLGISYQLK